MREIKKEIEILEELYQKLLIIKEVILRVLKEEILDKGLEDNIKEVLLKYNKLIISIRGMLKTRKKDVTNLSLGEKIVTYLSVKINLNKEEVTKNVANIIIQDINMNSKELEELSNKYTKISKTILNLIDRIINNNNNCVEILNKYV